MPVKSLGGHSVPLCPHIGSLQKYYKLTDLLFEDRHHFTISIISTRKMLTVPLLVCVMMALTGAAAGSCPGGWTANRGRCFLYVPTAMRWADAEKSCQHRGGNLASVRSFQEHQAIQMMIQRITHTYPQAWLGGYDAVREGTWFWSDGTPFNFNYWTTGEPNNQRHSEHCLEMNFGGNKKFNDESCDSSRPFVCSKKP